MLHQYPNSAEYAVPEKNVLLLSCIDLRLTDDLVRFMNYENLTNRYDHYILAGASLGYTLTQRPQWSNHKQHVCHGHFDTQNFDFDAWWKGLEQHLAIAVALHQVKDVYIVEHQHCGAYKAFVNQAVLKEKGEQGCQRESARLLANKISRLPFMKACEVTIPAAPADDQPVTQPVAYEKYYLRTHCFRMDIRGNVEWFYSATPGGHGHQGVA